MMHKFEVYLSGGQTVTIEAERWETRRDNSTGDYISYAAEGIKDNGTFSFTVTSIIGWKRVK